VKSYFPTIDDTSWGDGINMGTFIPYLFENIFFSQFPLNL